MKAAILAALLAPTSFAASPAPVAPPSSPALSLLLESFGAPGVETLAARGVLVLQGKPGARRLAAVHWKALVALDRAASSCLALGSAADALGKEAPPKSADIGLKACRALPADGLFTPNLAALAAYLQAAHEETWALESSGASLAGPAGKPNIFDTPWGKDLSARRHADALENPAALVKPLFDELLSAPRTDKDAAAALAAEASSRGSAAVDGLIAADAEKGALSEELRAQLRKTLVNERRRWAAAKARAAAADLLGKAAVKKELEDLRGIAKGLSARPGLPAALEAAASRATAVSGGPKLLSAGLHLQEPTRLGQHELGDDASASGAYWVDGLAEGASADVEETTAVETDRGFLAVETRSASRKNGGPYPYARTVRIAETRTFAFRTFVSAAGSNALAERAEVSVAKDFELALLRESEAAGLRAACRLKDAESAFTALEALVSEAGKTKPQYRDLAVRARDAAKTAKADAEASMKLEEALAAARADSAPQLCRYETTRVDEALKIAKGLPPGCDASLPELHALKATIQKRSVDQSWFLRASSDARSKRKSCDLQGALDRWSEALAALDADPGARCGKAAEEEVKAKAEAAEVARLLAWREVLAKQLAKAEAETEPAKRLAAVRPVTSRLGALDSGCFSAEKKKADVLASGAAKSLAAPADAEKRLPSDGALYAVVAEIKAERAKRIEAATSVEKAASEAASEGAAPAPKAAPAPAKKAPAHRPARKAKGGAQ